MELRLNNETNEKEIVYYILSLMVFISSFYISINLLVVNLIASIILFDILVLASSVYIFNIKRYSLFKYDLTAFLGTFYIFSSLYFASALKYVWQEQYTSAVTWLIIIGILLLCINYLILCIKQNSITKSRGFNIFFILVSYTYIVFIIIISFSWMYTANTKSSINEYINSSFKSTQGHNNFQITNYFSQPRSYLSYNKIKNPNIFSRANFNQKQLHEYLKARFAPVDKVEDFVLYSAENCFGGINVGISAEGWKMKYKLIVQKFLFLLITLVTVVSLSRKLSE